MKVRELHSLGWRDLQGTNALSYRAYSQVMKKMKVCEYQPRPSLIKWVSPITVTRGRFVEQRLMLSSSFGCDKINVQFKSVLDVEQTHLSKSQLTHA